VSGEPAPLSLLARELLAVVTEFDPVRVASLTWNRSERAVVMALAELRRAGLIRVEHGADGGPRVRCTAKGKSA
jgi:DNA-binding IscR family transcriptional regulator